MKRFARRNWGWWLVLWREPKFKVKLLYFKEGGAISMQRHQHRNELWLFLKGRGQMILEGEVLGSQQHKAKGDSLLISQKIWHKFTAEKKTWVLEIQYGELCCEKDIERNENI